MDLKVDMVLLYNCVWLKWHSVDHSVYCGGLPEDFACKGKKKKKWPKISQWEISSDLGPEKMNAGLYMEPSWLLWLD